MEVLNTEEFDMIVDTAMYWITHDKRVRLGKTKVDDASAGGEEYGFKQGMATAIGFMVTAERIKAFPNLNPIPHCTTHEVVSKLFAPMLEERERMLPKGHRHTQGIARELAIQLESICQRELEALIRPVVWLLHEAERHRRAVLDGTEAPTKDDEKWLIAHLQEQRDKSTSLEHLLTQARGE
jgi:hypothetical protein